jgi:hypothetical protein
MAVMGVAGLVLVSERHQEFEPMLGYPGEGPSSANRKATRAQEEELRKQVQLESAVLEDMDTDDEWIDHEGSMTWITRARVAWIPR